MLLGHSWICREKITGVGGDRWGGGPGRFQVAGPWGGGVVGAGVAVRALVDLNTRDGERECGGWQWVRGKAGSEQRGKGRGAMQTWTTGRKQGAEGGRQQVVGSKFAWVWTRCELGCGSSVCKRGAGGEANGLGGKGC